MSCTAATAAMGPSAEATDFQFVQQDSAVRGLLLGSFVEVRSDSNSDQAWIARVVAAKAADGTVAALPAGSAPSLRQAGVEVAVEIECQWLWHPKDAVREYWVERTDPDSYGSRELFLTAEAARSGGSSSDWNPVATLKWKVEVMPLDEYRLLAAAGFRLLDGRALDSNRCWYFRQWLDLEARTVAPPLPLTVHRPSAEFHAWCQARGVTPAAADGTTEASPAPPRSVTVPENPDHTIFRCLVCSRRFDNRLGDCVDAALFLDPQQRKLLVTPKSYFWQPDIEFTCPRCECLGQANVGLGPGPQKRFRADEVASLPLLLPTGPLERTLLGSAAAPGLATAPPGFATPLGLGPAPAAPIPSPPGLWLDVSAAAAAGLAALAASPLSLPPPVAHYATAVPTPAAVGSDPPSVTATSSSAPTASPTTGSPAVPGPSDTSAPPSTDSASLQPSTEAAPASERRSRGARYDRMLTLFTNALAEVKESFKADSSEGPAPPDAQDGASGTDSKVEYNDATTLTDEFFQEFEKYIAEAHLSPKMEHQKLHEIFQNLKRENNIELRRRVVSGELPIHELIRSDVKDLAPKALKLRREAEAKRYFQQQVLLASSKDAPKILRKTHKGLEEIEDSLTTPSSTVEPTTSSASPPGRDSPTALSAPVGTTTTSSTLPSLNTALTESDLPALVRGLLLAVPSSPLPTETEFESSCVGAKSDSGQDNPTLSGNAVPQSVPAMANKCEGDKGGFSAVVLEYLNKRDQLWESAPPLRLLQRWSECTILARDPQVNPPPNNLCSLEAAEAARIVQDAFSRYHLPEKSMQDFRSYIASTNSATIPN